MHDSARLTALEILNKVTEDQFTLDSIINSVLSKNTRLDKRDKSLLNILVFGVLRWKKKIDWIISNFSKTPLRKINPEVKNILRLGIFQICFLDKIPDSASVNTSVELAKKNHRGFIIKFINGLLRNCVRNKDQIQFPDLKKGHIKYLSVTKSFPELMIKKWLKEYGYDNTVKLCDFINDVPPVVLRTNTFKTTRDTLITELSPFVDKIIASDLTDTGISVTKWKKSIHETDPFEKGLFQVQDEASQLVIELLNPLPGEKILDACAGLGTKTGHIAQKMENQGALIATDSNLIKLESLNLEMKRLGFTIIETTKQDHLKVDNFCLEEFDKILIDAPCSGSGVLRRNPDAKWNLHKKNISELSETQYKLLESLKNSLKPGGILLYSVCSTNPQENEDVLYRFLKNNNDFKINKDHGENIQLFLNNEGILKLNPLIHKTDGFFAVSLKKQK